MIAAFAFPRTHRLLDASQYRAVFKRGKRFRQGPLLATVLPTGDQPARLGMVIGRKTSNRAVQRNRIKRQVRETFRQAGLRGIDVVIGATPAAVRCSNQQLRGELQRLWQQALNYG